MAKDKQQLPIGLRRLHDERKDTLGNILSFDYLYELSNCDINTVIHFLSNKFGDALRIIPIGGLSAGGNVFNTPIIKSNIKTVGLIISPPPSLNNRQSINYISTEEPPTANLKTQELYINKKSKIVYAGSGVVLEQINASVQDALGKNFQVLGTDITSKGYASAGATFMTGGMGPSRINFGKNIQEIVFNDGKVSRKVSNKVELDAFVETYGWTGLVESAALPIVEFPQQEFGFAVPVNNTPIELGQLITYFSKNTRLLIGNNKVINKSPVITGMELITNNSLSMLLKASPDLKNLSSIIDCLKRTNKNAIVFISGYAATNPLENINDPLGIFVENEQTNLQLEEAIPFTDLQNMTAIREGAPDLARSQYADYPFTYKNHTDINVCLNKNKVGESMQSIMKCYKNYHEKILNLIDSTENLKGSVQIYGHLHPAGVDPHYRISLASQEEAPILKAKATAIKFYSELVLDLNNVCSVTESVLTGGEKGILSNMKIIQALEGDKTKIQEELLDNYIQQKKAIQEASNIFNWRAKI